MTGFDRPSYGDTTAEYLSLHRDDALVGGRFELLRVAGSDAVSFLDGLLSQDVAAMKPGTTARSFLLHPQGKLASLLWLLRGEDEVLLATDPGLGQPTADQLGRFRVRVDATIEVLGSSAAALIGPRAGATLSGLGLDPPPGGWRREGESIVADLPMATGFPQYLVAGAHLPDVPAAGRLAFDALRVEVGEVLMGVDVDDKTIPQESGLVPEAVSFTKGCYLGQELVARIDSRGRVNRRLAGVRVEHNVVPPPGAELIDGDRTVGTITSPSESLELRAPVGLALVRREVEDGSTVDLRWPGGSAPATVLALPLFTES